MQLRALLLQSTMRKLMAIPAQLAYIRIERPLWKNREPRPRLTLGSKAARSGLCLSGLRRNMVLKAGFCPAGL